MKIFKPLLAAICGLFLIATPAAADTFPSKPIRLIVPFAPGGASDFVARIISPRLSQELGQPVIIVNRPGAAGNIGMEQAAAAAPDGYTAFLGNVGTLAVNPAVFGARQRVTAADFTPVTQVVNAPDILVVNVNVPVKNVAELVAYVRKTPNLSFASPGSGSLNRLQMELFRHEAKLEMVHVPFGGGAGPAINNVVGGHVPMMFAPMPATLQLIKGNRLKPIAVTSPLRHPSLPEVPTFVESGFPNVVGGSWQAVMLPANTPAPIVQRMFAALTKVLARDDVKEALAKGGVEVVTSASPKAAGEFIAEEARRWGAVAKAANVTAD